MKPLSATEIRGNWATLLLPIQADEQIDYGRLEAEIDYLIKAQVDGIYSNGSAGEFYTQTEAEFDRVNQTLAERCERAGMPFQIGATHTSAQMALERVKRAAFLQPSAIQVILPDWFAPSNEEALEALINAVMRSSSSATDKGSRSCLTRLASGSFLCSGRFSSLSMYIF
jgi:dihydrodipicolinate synthase/N-acetylneuraminate lyase